MNDGHGMYEAGTPFDPMDSEGDATGFSHSRRTVKESAATPTNSESILDWLPRLGPVLWLKRRNAEPERQRPSRPGTPLFVEHAAIGSLATFNTLQVNHAITPQGPREWLSFHSTSASIDAKLFLLPDSDVLAWDQMCSAGQRPSAETVHREPPTHANLLKRALARFGQRGQAHLLQFHFKRRPWMSVISAQPPLRISLLGIDIVRNIVRDENAEWISPSQLP